MPTAAKKKPEGKLALQRLRQEMSGLRTRVEDLEDLRDLNVAIDRNNGKPGTPWEQVKKELGVD
jgi:hypothetical protein